MEAPKLQSLKNNCDILNLPRKLILLTAVPGNSSMKNNFTKSLENNKLINLCDKRIKMAGHCELNDDEGRERAEHSCGELRYCVKMKDAMEKDYVVSGLSSHTIFLKQNDKIIKKPGENPMSTLEKRFSQGAKCILQPDKNKNFHARRNPSRTSRKKIDEDFPRPRLLAVKRRGSDPNYLEMKKLKFSDVPYMNTRSVTKRLYNVGATLQAPSINDEIELREWPVHGMHERPVYHPKVGVAVEFIGRCFASFDGESYQEIPKNLEFDRISNFYPRTKISKIQQNEFKNGISFENCMHLSLHSVLTYATQIMDPEYKKIDERIVNSKNSSKFTAQLLENCGNKNKVDEPKSFAQEAPKVAAGKSPISLMSIKNHAKLQQVLGRGKNTLILLKTLESTLKKDSNDSASEVDKGEHKSRTSIPNDTGSSNDNEVKKSLTKEDSKILDREKMIKELISDTAVLYCTAMGIHQDDVVNYIDNLRTIECDNFISTDS